MTTVEWLKQTKALTPSQQLGLSLRAIEQIFAEVEERLWRDTVYDHLCYPWSLSRIGNTLADIVYRAIMSLSGGRSAFRLSDSAQTSSTSGSTSWAATPSSSAGRSNGSRGSKSASSRHG
jgi:hypothetical protein